MREKLLWATVMILGATLAASRAQAPAAAVGRFQLFSAERETGRSKGPVVFRIDTQTGEVFTYHEGFSLPSETAEKTSERWAFWEKVDEQWIMHDGIQEAGDAVKRSARH
jgi:hypothetical protein